MSDVTLFEQVYARYAFFIDSFFRHHHRNSEATKNTGHRQKWYLGIICARRAHRSTNHAIALRHECVVALLDGDVGYAATYKPVRTIWEYEAELYYSLAEQLFAASTIEQELDAHGITKTRYVEDFATSAKLDGLARELESYGIIAAEIRERIVGQFDRS